MLRMAIFCVSSRVHFGHLALEPRKSGRNGSLDTPDVLITLYMEGEGEEKEGRDGIRWKSGTSVGTLLGKRAGNVHQRHIFPGCEIKWTGLNRTGIERQEEAAARGSCFSLSFDCWSDRSFHSKRGGHESSLPVAHPGYQVLSDILFRFGLIANALTQCSS